MHPILKKLSGGDRRSIGHSNEVVAQVLAHPAYFRHVFDGLSNDDAVVCMRAADVIEKITLQRPELLQPFKKGFLTIAASSDQQEVRWHVAQIIPRLHLTARDRAVTLDILFDYLRDKSSIVKTWAMQAIAELAAVDPELKRQVTPLLDELTLIGTPAMRARGRKILRQLRIAGTNK
jgi:hypothetical protein